MIGAAEHRRYLGRARTLALAAAAKAAAPSGGYAAAAPPPPPPRDAQAVPITRRERELLDSLDPEVLAAMRPVLLRLGVAEAEVPLRRPKRLGRRDSESTSVNAPSERSRGIT